MMNLRRVWVIQSISTGLFLTEDLSFSRSLKAAGRAPDLDHAIDTANDNFDPGEWEIHSFFEAPQRGE